MAAAGATLDTLAELAASSGQIPSAYWPERGHWDWGEVGCTDASAWFVIACADHIAATGDHEFRDTVEPAVRRALIWLRSQDATNTGLINSPEAGDWMDSSLSRSGRVLHVNVLYRWALLAWEAVDPALDHGGEDLGRRIDVLFWPEPGRSMTELLDGLDYPDGVPGYPHSASPRAHTAAGADRRYYLSHVNHAAFVDRCDVLANLLAILTGVAGPDRASTILEHLEAAGVSDPYPSRVWPEPVTEDDDQWQMWKRAAEPHIPARWRNPPWSYHNAGIWPYVGALHAAALGINDQRPAAAALLEHVAGANRVGDWGFHEWLHGQSGEPEGAPGQAWNAGAFLFAYHLLDTGRSDLPGV